MTLPTYKEIAEGSALLFLGAGFSAEATNLRNEQVKDVSQLIDQLLSAAKIQDRDGYDLDTASQEYLDAGHTEKELITLLHDNFRVKSATDHQKVIVTQPWYRIYTTNYDDLVEVIGFSSGKSVTTREVFDPVEPPIQDTTQLIHIYGNAQRSSAAEFKKTFLLTERQRDNSAFIRSSWSRRFVDDVLSASSITFVGFSLTDIDIRRLLASIPPHIKKKIYFVNRSTTKRPIQARLREFGELHLIGLEGFAAHLEKANAGKPERTKEIVPIALEELQFDLKFSSEVSSQNIQNLLVAGLVDLKRMSQSDVSGAAGSYTVTRSKSAYERATKNSDSTRPVLVHSDIGNGKTILSYQLAYLFAQTGCRVFRVRRETENLGRLISFFQSIEGPVVVIFDDLMRFRSLATSVMAIGRDDLRIVATVRTALLETARPAVEARLGRTSTIEIDLNAPSGDEARRIVRYLTENGLWGEYSDLTDVEKRAFVEKTCGGQFRDVILSLYESGALHERVAGLLGNIENLDDQTQRLIVFSALLAFAGFPGYSQLNILFDLVKYVGTFEVLRESLTSNELSGLIQIDSGELDIRSPALSEFIIRRIFNLSALLSVVSEALVTMDKYYLDDPDFERLSKGLLKFSIYGRLVKTSSDQTTIEKFYDECRTLKVAIADPLFWVQRSICNMSRADLSVSFKFVETAYATARGRPNFDTYQIDNHNARLLLTQTLREGVSPNGERESRAMSLLLSVLRRKDDDLYHPLSVMRLLGEIASKWGDLMLDDDRASFAATVRLAVTAINAFPAEQKGRFRNVDGIRKNLEIAGRSLTRPR